MGRETYLYGRGGGTGTYFLIFFGVVIGGGVLLATSSAEGIEVAGVGISPALATLTYLSVAGIGGWLAWSEVQSERFQTASQRPIELGPRSIVAPAVPDGRRMVKLSYADIDGLKVDTGRGEPWLYIKHHKGKLAISAEAMESYAAFQRMSTSLELRVSLAHGAQQQQQAQQEQRAS